MPHRRHRRHIPHRNSPSIPANLSATGPIAPTILPNAIVPASIPPKLPPRSISGHPLGTILTVPTYGPLPPKPGTIVPTIVPTVVATPTVVPLQPVARRRRILAAPPLMARGLPFGFPFIPGVALPRAHRHRHRARGN